MKPLNADVEEPWYLQRGNIWGLRTLHCFAIVVCFLSLFVFSVVTRSNGGREMDGKYYLGYKHDLREVTRKEFYRDQTVGSLLFGLGLVLFASFYPLERMYYSRAKNEQEKSDGPFSS